MDWSQGKVSLVKSCVLGATDTALAPATDWFWIGLDAGRAGAFWAKASTLGALTLQLAPAPGWFIMSRGNLLVVACPKYSSLA